MSDQKRIERLIKDRSPALPLAECVSLAVLVEPQLLRRMRLEMVRRKLLPPIPAWVEADLWFCDLVETRNSRGMMLRRDAGLLLRERLARRDFERFQQCWKIIQEMHGGSSQAMRMEEEIRYWAHCGLPEAEGHLNRLFSQTSVALVAGRRDSLASWGARMLGRLPPDTQKLKSARILRAGARLRLGLSREVDLPQDAEPPPWMSWVLPPDHPRVEVGVKLENGSVEFGDPADQGVYLIELPRTNPLQVQVRWREGERTLRVHQLHRRGRDL